MSAPLELRLKEASLGKAGRGFAAFLAAGLAATPASAAPPASSSTTPPTDNPGSAAQGQATPPKSDAGAHFDRGVSFYNEGDFSAALAEFKRALEIAPNWQVLFNVGQCYFQLRDYPNALTTLKRYVDEGGDRIKKPARATVDTELADLANRVAQLTIVSNLDGATVSVDDQVVGTTPIDEPVLVGAGMRRITATHEGREAVVQHISIAGGDSRKIELTFAEPAPLQPSPAPSAAPAGSALEVEPSPVPVYVSLGVAGVGIIVGSGFGLTAMGNKASLDQVCTPVQKACGPSEQGTLDALNRNATISTIGFAVGAVGVAVSVVLWIVEHKQSATAGAQTAPQSPSLTAGPGVLTGTW